MAHTLAAARVTSPISGSAGMREDTPTPGSRSGRWAAAAPATQSASRRDMSKQPNAPPVARASTCAVVNWIRPVRSSRETNGPRTFRSSTMACAKSSPMWRTAPRPIRTSSPAFSNVA
ncbi:Uncharacterised protein [Mycobacteroides abscessus subsp. abscessus]|nr:Uncharacterised protein [Mycobacteroides abscessus subsp. abscessus]